MDDTEKIAERYLSAYGFTDIEFEPDGNTPPDFLIDGRIAIECRRINQNFVSGEKYEGLELAERSLFRSINNFCLSSGPPIDGRTWFLSYNVNRPIPAWKETKRELDRLLFRLRSERPSEYFEFRTAQGMSIGLYPAEKPLETALYVGGWTDHQAGGFVVSELIRNIQICIDEKTTKIQTFHHKYPVWWLILVDRSNLGIEEKDIEAISDHVQVSNAWDRLVLIDPLNPHIGHDAIRAK